MSNRMAVLPPVFAAVVVLTGSSAQSQVPPASRNRSDALTTALTTILNEDWHPMPTDPRWLNIQRALDGEIAVRPDGKIAALAWRAAVRIEPHITSPVSQGLGPSLDLDTRPWCKLSAELPYAIDLHASLDGGPWVQIASASSSSPVSCREKRGGSRQRPPDVGSVDVEGSVSSSRRDLLSACPAAVSRAPADQSPSGRRRNATTSSVCGATAGGDAASRQS